MARALFLEKSIYAPINQCQSAGNGPEEFETFLRKCTLFALVFQIVRVPHQVFSKLILY